MRLIAVATLIPLRFPNRIPETPGNSFFREEKAGVNEKACD